jgi:hypothetical protein
MHPEGISAETLSKVANADDRLWLEEKLKFIGLDISKQIAAQGKHSAELRSLTRQNDWRAVFFRLFDLVAMVFRGWS